MRFAVSVTLIVCLMGSALPAAAQDPASDPIGRTIRRQAGQLAADQDVGPFAPNAEQGDQPAASDWSRIRKLQPGKKLVVTVKGEQPRKWTFKGADEDRMTVHDSAHSRVIVRSEVTEIATFTTQGSAGAAIAGAGLGAWLGIGIATGLGLTARCQPSCGGVETTMLLSAVGIPIGAAVAAYHLFGHSTKDVIYRAPQAVSPIRL
jgi:hypothetical protein